MLKHTKTERMTQLDNLVHLEPGNWDLAVDVFDQIPSVGQSRNTSDEAERDNLTTDRHNSHYTTVYQGVTDKQKNCFLCQVAENNSI